MSMPQNREPQCHEKQLYWVCRQAAAVTYANNHPAEGEGQDKEVQVLVISKDKL